MAITTNLGMAQRMDGFFSNEISSNPVMLFSLLVCMVIVFHFMFVWPRNLSKKTWKKIDYLWLAFGALGLIGVSADFRVDKANAIILTQRDDAVWRYNWMVRDLTGYNNSILCRKFIKNEYSPDNIDELNAEYDSACQWNKEMTKIITSKNATSLPVFSDINVLPLNVKDKMLLKIREDLVKSASDYKKYRNVYMKTQSEASYNTIDWMYKYLSPLLLCLALAIRITKISGELRYE